MITPENPASGYSHSVSAILQRLKDDDSQAAGEIWQKFFSRLLPLARARLRGLGDRVVDEEDVLVSVFDRFFRAVAEQRFARLEDRDDLWQILLMLTDHKVAEQYRRSHAKKRGGGEVASLNDIVDAGSYEPRELADREPPPEFVAAFNENLLQAMSRLDEAKTREVALMKLEGYENREIAERLEIGLSSVERKLRIIREEWQEPFA